MGQPTLFISDLHLDERSPRLTQGFLDFLERHKGACERLFILGDLFEAWIGDDDDNELSRTVAAALADFAESGAAVALMHGNRDFLLGEDYAARCNARLMQDSEIVESAGERFLLMHGDSLCTDDTDYQAFRAQVRQPAWQAQFLSQSLEARQAFAAQARAQSQSATAGKAQEIMDVNQAAVSECFERFEVTRLIHGHTHRPAIHALTTAGTQDSCERIVLGDWGDTAVIGKLIEGNFELLEINL